MVMEVGDGLEKGIYDITEGRDCGAAGRVAAGRFGFGFST